MWWWLPPSLTLSLHPSWTPLGNLSVVTSKMVSFLIFLGFILFFEKGFHCVAFAGLVLACSPGWPLTLRDPPVRMKGVCTTFVWQR